ncbi:MAG TPA: NAD(P)-dependent oxidoreductase [Solirubrobacterales bacterium]|nr:NAD(P)-dependent oxidoreductase [Solirubrobacterales bacterium]
MKVFVAGASGAIGKPLVRQLVAAGHEVTGMTRREERAEEIRAAGASAVVCDVFDRDALEAAMKEAAPEVVVHMLTALPAQIDWKVSDPLGPTNRVRMEGTRNLIEAARPAGARRVVAESVAFLYASRGDWVKDEEAPLFKGAPEPFGGAVEALADLERQVTGAEDLDGLVLRFGWFYGPGTSYASDGSQADEMRKRRLPIVGKGTGTFSFIHVEDAAAATVAALDRGAPGTYNVADDEPAPMREWLPVYAEAVGAKPPRRVPVWLAKLVAGRALAGNAVELRGASNAKAKQELGWEPQYASWRQGFREALG